MSRTLIATTIDEAYGRTDCQRYSPFPLSAALNFYPKHDPAPFIVGYDLARSKDYSTESLLCRDPITGAMKVICTTKIGSSPRRQGKKPPLLVEKRQEVPLSTLDELMRGYMYFDTWPWLNE